MISVINAERLVSTFIELCAIDAEPTRERPMADRLTALLGELGFVVTEDDAGVKLRGTAGNLYATLAGTGPGETLLFSCHMDNNPGTQYQLLRRPTGRLCCLNN